MLDRTDLRLITALHQHGQINLAAEHLGVTPTAVTKRLAQVEKKLGVKLFARSTRRLSTSDEGALCVQLAHELMERFEEMESRVTERSKEAVGHIRLVCNPGFGRIMLAPQLAAFQAAHPRISLDLHLSNDLPELIGEGFDAAIWLWGQVDAQWVSQRLAPNYRVLVAAPGYVQQHPAVSVPQDLTHHECICMSRGNVFDRLWRLETYRTPSPSAPIEVKIKGRLRSSSGEVIREWALQGHGIALRPLWDVHSHIRSGALVHVLPDYAQLDSDVLWVAPFRAVSPRRVTLLKQWLEKAFAKPPWTSIA